MQLVKKPSLATGLQMFTGLEYVYIDLANQYGFDKENFETRIATIEKYKNELRNHVSTADEPALFLKAVFAYEDAINGLPSGHLVGFDACASGMQIMSCFVGCAVGAMSTGLVDPTVRKDVYGDTVGVMNNYLEAKDQIGKGSTKYSRTDVKDAEMTHFYGSKAEPIEIFGKGSAHFNAFYKALDVVAPGANALTGVIIDCWQPYAKEHSYTLCDDFTVILRNMVEKTVIVRIDELGGQFSHIIRVNEGEDHRVSLVANITHSVDGLIVRELGRRCDYDLVQVNRALKRVNAEMALRGILSNDKANHNQRDMLATNIALNAAEGASMLSNEALQRLHDRFTTILVHPPFAIICNHDEFKCHPNYMNYLRKHFNEVMAEIADSYMIEDILRQITGDKKLKLVKESTNLGDLIRNSNYGIC